MKAINEIVNDNLGIYGRMLASSKAEYIADNPDNLVVFNANVFMEDVGHIWYGDLDLTQDYGALKNVASEAGLPVYVFPEAVDESSKPDKSRAILTTNGEVSKLNPKLAKNFFITGDCITKIR